MAHLYEVEIDHDIPTIPPTGDRPRKLLVLVAHSAEEAVWRVESTTGEKVLGVTALRPAWPHEVQQYEVKRASEKPSLVTTDA